MPPTQKQIEKEVRFLANSLDTALLILREYQSEIEIQALIGELISTKRKIIKELRRLDRERMRKLEEKELLTDNQW
ncbi:hypothetical protein KKA14_02265 [bacterium]|nr:hypothetical protein [bacterium]